MANISITPESSYNADELGQYQSLSTAAVMALVLGLLSAAAFFSPLLLVVPFFTIAVALWALARIRSSEGGLQGARLAYCGLALAIVFGVASVTRVQVRVEILRRQATEVAERWLSMLGQGQVEEALGLMTSKAKSKISDPGEGSSLVPIFEAELSGAQLLQDPLAVALIEMHQSDKGATLQSEKKLVFDLPKPRAVFYYKMPNAEAQDSLFLLSLVKTGGGHLPGVWLIDAWDTEGVVLP